VQLSWKKKGRTESKEKVTSADFLFAVVLAEVEELEYISVPRFKVDGESSWTLVSTLVDLFPHPVRHLALPRTE
jgi:hypothetical protein